MRWEELTSADLDQAASDTGLCVVPVGSLEYHAPHLPLGTDAMAAHEVAVRAAQREPAVVFPAYFFGQVNCARHYSGAIAVNPKLHNEMLGALCDEIGRAGFKKILLHNGHGGNSWWLRYFAQCCLYERRPYCVYATQWLADPQLQAQVRKICTTGGGHADETETSMMLAIAPGLVKMDRVPPEPGMPQRRLKHLPGVYSGIWWYADYPTHYAGDARTASAEKGQKLMEIYVTGLADAIRQIKQDQTVPTLEKEFFDKCDGVARP